MQRKITLLIVIIFINLLSCTRKENLNNKDEAIITFDQTLDSIAGIKIDSVNKVVQAECDSAKKYRLPLLVDSIINQYNNP